MFNQYNNPLTDFYILNSDIGHRKQFSILGSRSPNGTDKEGI